MKLIKYCYYSILSTVPKIIAIVGWIYLVFVYKIEGKSICSFIYDLCDSFVMGFDLDTKPFWMQLTLIILGFVAIGFLELIFNFVIPFTVYMLADGFCEKCTVKKKNIWCQYMYDKETREGKPHQKRETGDEWLRRKREKEKEERRESEEEEYRKKEAERERRDRERERAYQQWEEFTGKREKSQSSSSGSYKANNSELQKAMDAFFLDDLNITQDELKKIRNKLVKSFHPDGSADTAESTLQTQKINKYYDILKAAIKK